MELHLIRYSDLKMVFTKMYSFLVCNYRMNKTQATAYYRLINLNFSIIFNQSGFNKRKQMDVFICKKCTEVIKEQNVNVNAFPSFPPEFQTTCKMNPLH